METWWAAATLVISKKEGRGNHGERDNNERVTASEAKWPSRAGRRVTDGRVRAASRHSSISTPALSFLLC